MSLAEAVPSCGCVREVGSLMKYTQLYKITLNQIRMELDSVTQYQSIIVQNSSM